LANAGLDGSGPARVLRAYEDEVRPGRVVLTVLNTAGNYETVLTLDPEQADKIGRQLRQGAQRARELGERHHVQ
jgi:hypothetical protein